MNFQGRKILTGLQAGMGDYSDSQLDMIRIEQAQREKKKTLCLCPFVPP